MYHTGKYEPAHDIRPSYDMMCTADGCNRNEASPIQPRGEAWNGDATCPRHATPELWEACMQSEEAHTTTRVETASVIQAEQIYAGRPLTVRRTPTGVSLSDSNDRPHSPLKSGARTFHLTPEQAEELAYLLLNRAATL